MIEKIKATLLKLLIKIKWRKFMIEIRQLTIVAGPHMNLLPIPNDVLNFIMGNEKDLISFLMQSKEKVVYITQPERGVYPGLHIDIAQILADASKHAKIVCLTHSPLILLTIQALVVEGALPAESVKLHWISKNDRGNLKIYSEDLDSDGAFGDWPEEFGDIELNAQSRYLNALYDKHFPTKSRKAGNESRI